MAEEKKAKQKGAPAAEATGAPAVKPVSVAEKLRACLVAVKKVVGDDKTCFETLLKCSVTSRMRLARQSFAVFG